MTGRDFAYACFAYVGALAVASLMLEVLPFPFSTYQVLGMVVGIPAVILALVASGWGVVLTCARWREWPLVSMSVALLGYIGVFVIGESLSVEESVSQRTALNLADGVLMAVIVTLSGRWYFFDFRRRSG
ncbi:hypothetical protein H8E07_06755 [bacterium]|nr:hypothetical protein [bacterium]